MALPLHQWPEATSHTSTRQNEVDAARYASSDIGLDSEAARKKDAAEQLFAAVAKRNKEWRQQITQKLQNDVSQAMPETGAA